MSSSRIAVRTYADGSCAAQLLGYPIDEIDVVARALLDVLVSEAVEPPLAQLALSRALVAVNYDLDSACRIIDDISSHLDDLPELGYADADSSGETEPTQ